MPGDVVFLCGKFPIRSVLEKDFIFFSFFSDSLGDYVDWRDEDGIFLGVIVLLGAKFVVWFVAPRPLGVSLVRWWQPFAAAHPQVHKKDADFI